MKSLFPALLAALLLLSACTGETAVSPSTSQSVPPSSVEPSGIPPAASADQAAPAWWESISTDNLPDTLSAAEDIEAGSGSLYRLAELTDKDIVLYGYGGNSGGPRPARRRERPGHFALCVHVVELSRCGDRS